MAVPLIETLTDLLSASSGALVGAVVTGLFNRSRRRELSDQVLQHQQALERQQQENARLLDVIREKENIILELQVDKTRRATTQTRHTTPQTHQPAKTRQK